MTEVEAARTIHKVKAQQLGQRFGPRFGVGEARAVYGAEFASGRRRHTCHGPAGSHLRTRWTVAPHAPALIQREP
jgi:hypothetical protein